MGQWDVEERGGRGGQVLVGLGRHVKFGRVNAVQARVGHEAGVAGEESRKKPVAEGEEGIQVTLAPAERREDCVLGGGGAGALGKGLVLNTK